MALRRETLIDVEQLDDVELARRAATGESRAFEVLYRRHADAAWRMAQAVVADPEDAADAVADAFTNVLAALAAGRLDPGVPFRPYLLVATRNAAVDVHRRNARLQPGGDSAAPDPATADPSPSDRMEAAVDAGLLCQAFRSLPERWRTVLWLTEVEGIPAREVGARLGLTPNGAAQLTRRAREGLRDRFLQAHLANGMASPACGQTVNQLGAFTAGSLSPRASAAVEAHLATCAECRARADELTDIGRSLRGIPLPIPIALGAGAMARFSTHFGTTARVSLQATEQVTRAMAVSTAVLLALGVTTAGLMSGGNGPTAVPGGRSGGSIAAPASNRVAPLPDGPALGPATPGGHGDTVVSAGTTGAAPIHQPPPPTPVVIVPTPSTHTAPPTTTAPPKPSGLGVNLGANLGLTTASVALSLSGGCTGVSLAGSSSCAPSAPASPGLTLSIVTPLGTIAAGPAAGVRTN